MKDSSSLREFVEQVHADLESVERAYPLALSVRHRDRRRKLLSDWGGRLEKEPFEALNHAGRVDYLLLRNYLAAEQHAAANARTRIEKQLPLVPFWGPIVSLEQSRRSMDDVDPAKAAETLDSLAKLAKQATADLEKTFMDNPAEVQDLIQAADTLAGYLKDWYGFYDGFDPLFSWWTSEPYAEAERELKAYEARAKELCAGKTTDGGTPIVGKPIGREALLKELEFEMIPYTPEELIAFGEQEFEFCVKQIKNAAKDLGLPEDVHAAIEHAKGTYVEPGKQTQLVRNFALEAIQYLEDNDLITIPELAKETWRMEMMSPEKQLVNPFFLGGEVIVVSYPTQSMSHSRKLMSMRGNNAAFSRATVQHELIPGHHLQQFTQARHRPYRLMFETPFWIEGWALYWEMRLWDLGFPRTPEERIGMMFWRLHRCARVVFSLKFHLGQMDAQECIEMLVEQVGHERANAEGEVRRSLSGSYPPLYQAAYMIGGLQFRAMHKELVESKRMTDRAFHDAILAENSIPPALLRTILVGEELQKDKPINWRF